MPPRIMRIGVRGGGGGCVQLRNGWVRFPLMLEGLLPPVGYRLTAEIKYAVRLGVDTWTLGMCILGQ